MFKKKKRLWGIVFMVKMLGIIRWFSFPALRESLRGFPSGLNIQQMIRQENGMIIIIARDIAALQSQGFAWLKVVIPINDKIDPDGTQDINFG